MYIRWFFGNLIFGASNPAVVSRYLWGRVIHTSRVVDQLVVENASGNVPAYLWLERGHR